MSRMKLNQFKRWMANKSLPVMVLSLISLNLTAKGPDQKQKDKNDRANNPTTVAGCTPANSIVYLEFNNVRARIEAGGFWWKDRPNNVAGYEVPKGSNSYPIYAGGLWMAGTDVNGQLKAAASLYLEGVDFWTGPLDNIGTAEIDEATCEQYDNFFDISRQQVAEFVLYNEIKNDPAAMEESFPDGYNVPKSISEWPGNGDLNKNQAPKLAPYVDVNGDGFYDDDDGDYPFYDLEGNVDCRAPRATRSESSSRPLFGDQTYWWIFNDKGNLHTETNAPSIGMEIHAQAFAFATNDEINDMTFYNFELINRSTFTLTDTYFASYVDSDLGNFADDYVGCDVARGFGYCYNADEFDESVQGQTGYGNNPAAIGIDFFEGPYQDADGIDNEIGIGYNQALNGLGYSDSIADNERYGMRRFIYFNSDAASPKGDPVLAIHYYNFMRGIWKNGQTMRHGGDGFNTAGVEPIPTAFMFPGDTDPLGWGVTFNGVTATRSNLNWTEDNPGGGQAPNDKGDRRFLQSAGPFTLEPGNVNDITVGVVFAQAESGGRLASVDKLITADDKAQALFSNCFQVLSGPDAPDLTIQELDQELIIYLSNGELSNNKNEAYEEEDPNIITPDTVRQILGRDYDNKYRFQGYQVYQLKANDVSISQLNNPDVARLAFQCDIADNVTTLTNFTFDEGIGANIPETKVVGNNEGIVHSFRVTEDLFATGESRLVNYKTYYYIAIAYAYNNFKRYQQDAAPDLSNPLAPASDGQKTPYLASRKSSTGGSIESVAAIPHNYRAEANGTVKNSNYGDLVGITRLSGTGNGNNAIRMTDATIDRIMEEKAWEKDESQAPVQLDYRLGAGPLTVKVVDPLNVIDGKFVFKFLDELVNNKVVMTDTAEWMIYLEGGGEMDTVYSERTIKTRNEQLLFNPNWGLSVLVEQAPKPGIDADGNPGGVTNGYLGASIRFDDPTRPWLSGIADQDRQDPYDWILSGVTGGVSAAYGDRSNTASDFIDPNQDYESILGGIISPYALVGYGIGNPNTGLLVNKPGFDLNSENNSKIEYLNSLILVYTKDKSKWTRCPVLEMQEEPTRAITGDAKYRVRTLPSIDKEGNPWTPGSATDVTDPENAAYIDSMGMGWFPGYALNAETGERYNMAYGEDSWYGVDNGADMIFNPTSTIATGVQGATNLVWGGKHVVYVFRKSGDNEGIPVIPGFDFKMNYYDGGAKLVRFMRNNQLRPFAWRACSWVMMPILVPGQELLSNDVRIDVNVAKPFDLKYTDLYDSTFVGGDTIVDSTYANSTRPVYTFETRGFAVRKGETSTLKEELKRVNVVPNPYYAISNYETSAVDNRIKITNLPTVATIKIYNMSGTLIRTYKKSDPTNYLDWDLKNEVGIPISSGVYIIHIEVPNVGEKIIKWFGVMRPVDLNNF